ncbi:hypothetical protein E4U41_006378, partial [Claviceps citrina]
MAAQRDYYADLELSRDADINEIKKQFRKLALKYHPDRNPGREQEVNAKFQIIQAAHEILSDSTGKAKYDASLGRGRYSGASGVRGNPWANAGAQFPTPPRRTNAAAGAARSTPNAKNAQSGAQRWQSRFASGIPPTAKQKFGADAEAKKNAAKAFENMRKSAQKEPQPSEPPPTPPPPPPRQPPRTESARQRAEASFGSHRKSGYYPRSTMPGDEPPVASHNYSKFERRDVPPPPPQRPGPDPMPMPDPLSQFREGKSSSASTRPSPDSTGGQPHQSTSGRTGLQAESPSRSRPDATSSSDDVHAKPGRTTSASFATKNKAPNSEDGPSMYGHPYSQSFFSSPNLDTPQSTPSRTGIQHMRPAAQLESSRSLDQAQSQSGTSCDSVASLNFERKQTSMLNELIESKDQHEILTDQCRNCSFSFPLDEDSFKASASASGTRSGGHGFAKSSVDDFDTSFVNDDEDSNTWQFNAGAGEAEANVGNGCSSPCARRNRHARLRRPTMGRDYGANTASSNSNASQAEGGFHAEGWSDKFGPQTFVPQAVPGPCVSPTRTSRANSKRSKAKPTAADAAAAPVEVDSSDEETYDWRGRSAQAQGQARPAATDSPQAMDIDTPSSEGPRAQAARNIHVEPSRPEWRAGNVDGTSPDEEIPRRPAKLPLDPNTIGSEDSDEFRASFADLKNVAPLSQPKDGLGSLHGLRDSLPFESRASDVPPV